jgi:predicted permease
MRWRFWRRSRPERDFADEIQSHLEMEAERLEREGLSPDEARYAAQRDFGNATRRREEYHERQRMLWVDHLRQDVGYAVRSLCRAPVVVSTVVLTLALGLGANAAMFSLLDVLYLRPPAGVVDPGGVHRVWQQEHFESGLGFGEIFGYPKYRAMREALAGVAMTAIYRVPEEVAIARGEHAPRAGVTYVSASYFGLLGVHPERGRFFTADEDRLGSPTDVAVVSDAFWRDRLGGAGDVLGRSITVSNRPFTIIGVAPPGFTGVDIDAADVWLPFAAYGAHGTSQWWESRRTLSFQILLRPHAGVPVPQLDARITRAFHRPELLWQPGDTLTVAELGSIIKTRGPGEAQQEMRIAARLGGVALLVLLIAVANVVNLLLARAVQRRREIAVRLALGISRLRLVRLLVTESVLLSVLAGTAALMAAYWGGGLLRTLLLPRVNWATTPLHWRVLLFSLAITLAAGVVAGLIPALQSTRPDLTRALKAGARAGTGQHARLRGALVLLQAALSVVLLVGAALFLDSLRNVRGLDIGFDADRLLFADVRFATHDSVRDARLAQELGALGSRLRTAPGVQQVALASMPPMYGFSFMSIFPDADTVAHKLSSTPTFTGVSPEYFQTVGIRVLRGTGFSLDDPPQQTVVINEALARALWPGENPIGRCMRFEKPDAPCYTISGIVETSRRDRVIEKPEPQYYLPLGRMPVAGYDAGTLVVRTDPRTMSLVTSEIQRTIRRAFPTGSPVITRMTDWLEPQYRPWKLGATLFTLFGVLALAVAAVGIYSTISYGVSQRVHEFGVRAALGARTSDVVRHVLGGALRQVGLGVAAGIMLALAGGRLIAALLYGVRPSNPVILVAVAVVLLCVAAVAAFVPAWRAARVDPVIALRAE